MNEQQGKHLDQRVRQALSNLPDVPAPGTGFDSGKLWEQLRPELATQPVMVPKRMGRVRWLVAASLAGVGLFLGWLLLVQPKAKNLQIGRGVARHVVKKEFTQPRQRTQPEQTLRAILPEKESQLAIRQQIKQGKEPADTATRGASVTDPQPTPATINVPANLPVADTGPTEPAPVQSGSALVARKAVPTYSKRRFAVVHQNELRAEAETRDKLERNDRFVRLGGTPAGASSSVPITPAEEKPSLIIPLN